MKKRFKIDKADIVIFLLMVLLLFIILNYLITWILSGTNARANVLGYKLVYVASGSMEPYIMTGDIILCKMVKEEEIEETKVYTYIYKTDTAEKTIIHRVIEKNEDGTYVFKGDNNEKEDPEEVQKEQICAQYICTITSKSN